MMIYYNIIIRDNAMEVINVEQLLTIEGRIWFKEQYADELEGYSVTEQGWLELEEGIPVDDRFIITEKLKTSALMPA